VGVGFHDFALPTAGVLPYRGAVDRFRELALGFAGVFIGAAIGGFLTAGGAGSTFSPDHWYWPVVWGCLGAGAVLMVIYIGMVVGESRRRRSPALAIEFAEQERDSIMSFVGRGLPQRLSTASTAASAAVASLTPLVPIVLPNAEVVRLCVNNLRKHTVRTVHVRLEKIRTVQSENQAHHRDWLKWMHDDTPEHPRSLEGIELARESSEFVDLATYVYGRQAFAIDYAIAHLRASTLPIGSYFIHVVGVGQDEQGWQVPDCHAAFELAVTTDGLTVSPRTLAECGFGR